MCVQAGPDSQLGFRGKCNLSRSVHSTVAQRSRKRATPPGFHLALADNRGSAEMDSARRWKMIYGYSPRRGRELREAGPSTLSSLPFNGGAGIEGNESSRGVCRQSTAKKSTAGSNSFLEKTGETRPLAGGRKSRVLESWLAVEGRAGLFKGPARASWKTGRGWQLLITVSNFLDIPQRKVGRVFGKGEEVIEIVPPILLSRESNSVFIAAVLLAQLREARD